MARGPKHHLKRVNAPKHWMLGKMDGAFAPRPSTGPHKLRECLPLILILRNRLKYAITGMEAKQICMSKHVKVDGVGQANPRRAQHVLEGRHDRTIDLLEDTDTGRPGDHGLGPDLGEFTFDLGGRALRVERHGDHARTKDAEPGAHETEVGRAQDRNPVARFESKRDENPARLLDLGGQLPVGDAVAASDDGGAFCGMISEEGREVHSGPSWQVRGPIPPTIQTIFGADDNPENARVGPEVGLRLSRPARRTATRLRQG